MIIIIVKIKGFFIMFNFLIKKDIKYYLIKNKKIHFFRYINVILTFRNKSACLLLKI
jgi:hypothetical protein